MTITEMHQFFKVGVDKSESFSYPSFQSEEIDYFLNKAQERFIKQRYGINNLKGQGFEQTQKRTDDIREVIMYNNSSSLGKYLNGSNTDDNKPYAKYYTLPNTAPSSVTDSGDVYWFSIQEEAEVVYTDATSSSYTINSAVIPSGTYIVTETLSYDSVTYYTGESFVFSGASFSGTKGTFKSTKSKRVGVKPIQHDDYNKIVNDPFNKPNHDQAVRLMLGDKVEIITGAEFDITKFYMRYVRKPLAVDFANTVDCELANHTHEEIVDLAVSIALEDIESGRYQTHLNELNKNE